PRPAPVAHHRGQFLDRGRWPGPALRWRPGRLPRLAAAAASAAQPDYTRCGPDPEPGPQGPAPRTGSGAAGTGSAPQAAGSPPEAGRGSDGQGPGQAGGTGRTDGRPGLLHRCPQGRPPPPHGQARRAQQGLARPRGRLAGSADGDRSAGRTRKILNGALKTAARPPAATCAPSTDFPAYSKAE